MDLQSGLEGIKPLPLLNNILCIFTYNQSTLWHLITVKNMMQVPKIEPFFLTGITGEAWT